ncbi:MAG: four helix bundle protein [Parvularculaceae bacterium]
MDDREWDEEAIDVGAFGLEEGDRSGTIQDHRDLDVWRLAMDLAVEIYAITAKFPREETYGLISQIRRATVSISANIAEGYGRETTGAYIQFLRVAQGSTREVQSLLELSVRLVYLLPDSAKPINLMALRISKMLRSLIRALENKAKH